MSEKVVVALNALINPANAGGSESSALSIVTNFRDAAPPDIDMYVTALPQYAEAMRAIRGVREKVIVWPWREFTPVSSEPSGVGERPAAALRSRIRSGSVRLGSRASELAAFRKTMPSAPRSTRCWIATRSMWRISPIR